MSKSGIYKIQHTESGRLYIGSSFHISKRWAAFKWRIKKYGETYQQAIDYCAGRLAA